MTVVAAIFLPFVLLYQAWTYWVFRRRISTADIPHGEGEGASVTPSASAAGQPAGPGAAGPERKKAAGGTVNRSRRAR
jgi:cytochrome d ubiquinol oxidase subunit II